MSKINTVALTEKGVVKSKVRKALIATITPEFENFEQVENKATFYKEYADQNGTPIYVVADVRVTANDPAEVKPAKVVAKPVAEPVTID